MYALKQSQTARPLLFPMFQTDGTTPATGLTPTVTLSKNGGAFASPAGAVTEISAGWYKVAGNATDTATLGPLVLHATDASAADTDVIYEVVAYDPQDSVRLGLTALPNAAAGANGGLPTGNASGQVAVGSFATGVIDAAAIAADAIGSSELAASAASEIASAVRTELTTELGRVDVAVSTRSSHSAADVWAVATRALTDKAGFSLSTAGVQAIWDALTSALTTVGSIGKRLADDIDATISSRNSTTPPTAGTVASAVWNEALSGHTTTGTSGAALTAAGSAGDPWATALPGSYGAGSAGKLVSDNLNATVSSRLASASYTAPDNADIATILAAVDTEVGAIKARTDLIPNSPAAVGSAMTLDLTQAVGNSQTTGTVGDAFLAAEAQGAGKWTLSGTTLTLYRHNGTTVYRTFTLDDATTPTSRT